MEAREFVPGAWTLYLLADGSREFVREFLEELKSHRPQEYKKIVARLRGAAVNGPPRNTQHFRQIQGVSGHLAEFKADQVRIVCFFDGGCRAEGTDHERRRMV
ncbi:MAG: hypothetical protein ACRDJE_25485 [Dehalococcoidia bacterium]